MQLPETVPESEYRKALDITLKLTKRWFYRQSMLPPSVDLEDYEQAARLGVWRATEKFDPARGCAFSTIAVRYGLGYVKHLARDSAPGSRRDYARGAMPLDVSLDAPVRDGEGALTTFGNLLASKTDPAAEVVEQGVWQCLRKLAPRDAVILRLRYQEELNQSEVGRRLGLSQMTISRNERAALGKLRDLLQQEPLW